MVILQGLSDAAKTDVTISFTPHLMPMTRGMQSTIYVKLAGGATVDELRTELKVQSHAPSAPTPGICQDSNGRA